jgi:hypothetical protein
MKRLFTTLVLLIVFSAGIAAGLFVSQNHIHPPLDDAQFNSKYAESSVAPQKKSDTQLQEAVYNSLLSFFSNKSPERESPQDRIKEHQIHVYQDKVILDIKDPEWAKFSNTNSMDPIIDENANAIQVIPKSEDEIEIGDIISYKIDGEQFNIIHRVIGKGQDNEGTFFYLKGDNNPTRDPSKVRFDQIDRVLVAIVY